MGLELRSTSVVDVLRGALGQALVLSGGMSCFVVERVESLSVDEAWVVVEISVNTGDRDQSRKGGVLGWASQACWHCRSTKPSCESP